MSSGHELKEIVLRDIEPLLKQRLGEGLTVESFTTKPLLPPGENYGSTIFSVHVIIRRNNATKPEDLYLIAKMPPPTEFQRRIFDSPHTFNKESFMYEEIMPSYNKLELEAGLKEDELFDVLPKFYGKRFSLDPNVGFDDDAVILLENLKIRGYYTGDRFQGNDMEHARIAIRAMARFHAIGMAMKYKKPEYFEILKVRAKCVKLHAEEFEESFNVMKNRIEKDEVLGPYTDKVIGVMKSVSTEELWTAVPKEPWSTIIHADFWVNNIMFHRNDNGKVDDIKFVDFQNYLFMNPLREMIFYILSSVDDEGDETNIDVLLSLYHDTFISVLSRLGCDTESFTREKFDTELNKVACCEFTHVCFMLKVLTLNAEEVDLKHSNLETAIMDYAGNENFILRLRKVIFCFLKRNWI